MVKNILVVGASGLVGSNILELLEDGDSKITLLTRRKLEDKAYLKQIISEFNKPKIDQTKLKKTESSEKNTTKPKKISKK